MAVVPRVEVEGDEVAVEERIGRVEARVEEMTLGWSESCARCRALHYTRGAQQCTTVGDLD